MEQNVEKTPVNGALKTISDARGYRGLTQIQLSKITGITQAEISKLEKGERNPSIKILERLADGMGMTLDISFIPKEL